MHIEFTNSMVDDKMGLLEKAACQGWMKNIVNNKALHAKSW